MNPRMNKTHILNEIAEFINDHKGTPTLDDLLPTLRTMWKAAWNVQDDVLIKRIVEKLNLCRWETGTKLSMGRDWVEETYSWVLVKED